MSGCVGGRKEEKNSATAMFCFAVAEYDLINVKLALESEASEDTDINALIDKGEFLCTESH